MQEIAVALGAAIGIQVDIERPKLLPPRGQEAVVFQLDTLPEPAKTIYVLPRNTQKQEQVATPELDIETKLRIIIVPGLGGQDIFTKTVAKEINRLYGKYGVAAETPDFSSDMQTQAKELDDMLDDSPTDTVLLGYSAGTVSTQVIADADAEKKNKQGKKKLSAAILVAPLNPNAEETKNRMNGHYRGIIGEGVNTEHVKKFVPVALYVSSGDQDIFKSHAQVLHDLYGATLEIAPEEEGHFTVYMANVEGFTPQQIKDMQDQANKTARKYAKGLIVKVIAPFFRKNFGLVEPTSAEIDLLES